MDVRLASEANAQSARRRWRRASRYLLGAIIPLGVIAAWQIAADRGTLSPLIFASPWAVVKELGTLIRNGQLWGNLRVSLIRILLGFSAATALAVTVGVASGLNRWVERTIDPAIQLFRAMPAIAILPLFIVWFGAGESSKIIFIIIALFPLYYNDVHTGVKNVDKKLLEVGKVFDLRRHEVVFGIIIPSASPFIFNGARRSAVMALLLLIFAELLNAQSGLGYLLNEGMTYFNVQLTMGMVLVFAALGLTFDSTVRLVQWLVMPWRRKGVR